MKPIGKTISMHRKAQKLTQNDLCKKLEQYGFHIKNSAVSSWEKDVSVPSATQFLALCKILSIKDIYHEFIGFYKNDPLAGLNEIGQNKALDYIRLLVQSGEYKQEEATVIPFIRTIQLFDIPASAGTGEFLDSGSYEEIQVGDEVPTNADFGIRIQGDSMEPRFISGQIVWVQRMDHLSDGEIGIFYLNGYAYIKKLQDNKNGSFLISLNKKYEPIKIGENSEFRTFGKVVG